MVLQESGRRRGAIAQGLIASSRLGLMRESVSGYLN
jgi:hypothetical protein